ncbi:alpha/beta fold hydrolase [Namhaeicola litoreus]|uniref:Alpha/beta fold hydrolase n=1 Tax=Namhaeicola litoreus TaxID=1052145 RepID=A0ABW3Y1U3_9FLAO
MKKRITILLTFILSITLLLISCEKSQKSKPENIQRYFYTAEQYKFTSIDKGIQMAYLDIGQAEDPIVLLLHGEPNSSFVYRHIAPLLLKQNFRVIIPDLVGFGYSDKPKNPEQISYTNQTKWLNAFMDQLELQNINLFAHDWGGMIALRIVANRQDLFSKVAISYSYLFEGDEIIPESFNGFKHYAQNEPNFSPGNIMDWGTKTKLPDSVKAKYDSPFQQPSDFYFVRKFPSLIPTTKEDPEAVLNKELNEKLKLFSKPFITIWGDHEDLMWKDKDSLLQVNILGAQNQSHYLLDSGHFIQEDKPIELAQILIAFFKGNT